jgi:hypothetical protein
MANVTTRKREPNKYLRACVLFIKKSFLDRENEFDVKASIRRGVAAILMPG